MFSKKYYARRRAMSSVFNFLWSVIMLVVSLVVLALIVYGCSRYLHIIGPEIE